VDQESPEERMAFAEEIKDSWWPDYVHWLRERSGPEIDAPKILGAEYYPPLGPAPGSYVLQK
jgi:poly(3-hydroxyalkanoate) synthetase